MFSNILCYIYIYFCSSNSAISANYGMIMKKTMEKWSILEVRGKSRTRTAEVESEERATAPTWQIKTNYFNRDHIAPSEYGRLFFFPWNPVLCLLKKKQRSLGRASFYRMAEFYRERLNVHLVSCWRYELEFVSTACTPGLKYLWQSVVTVVESDFAASNTSLGFT